MANQKTRPAIQEQLRPVIEQMRKAGTKQQRVLVEDPSSGANVYLDIEISDTNDQPAPNRRKVRTSAPVDAEGAKRLAAQRHEERRYSAFKSRLAKGRAETSEQLSQCRDCLSPINSTIYDWTTPDADQINQYCSEHRELSLEQVMLERTNQAYRSFFELEY